MLAPFSCFRAAVPVTHVGGWVQLVLLSLLCPTPRAGSHTPGLSHQITRPQQLPSPQPTPRRLSSPLASSSPGAPTSLHPDLLDALGLGAGVGENQSLKDLVGKEGVGTLLSLPLPLSLCLYLCLYLSCLFLCICVSLSLCISLNSTAQCPVRTEGQKSQGM